MSNQKFEARSESIAKTVVVGNGKLSYEVAGNGPVVLCLPGMGDTRRVYERFVPALLEAGYRVITTDLRGNGQSQGKFSSHNLNDLASDIGAILDAEGVEKAYLAAGSISGASAGLFASQQPQRVLGLILFSPVFDSPSRLMMSLLIAALRLPGLGAPIWGSYFKTLYPKHPVEADYLAQVKASIGQKGGLKSLTDMLWSRHLDAGIRQIKAPTLIFFGTKDGDFKSVPAEAARVQTELPQARIEILEGIGHYPQREAAEQVIPQTLQWLAAQKA